MRDAAAFGQVGQDTPFGSSSFTGEIGSPDRRQSVTLNPQDQARLDQERSIKSKLLGMILGGAQGMGEGGGMPQAQGKQGQAQPMPAMSLNEPQPQGTAHANSTAHAGASASHDGESALWDVGWRPSWPSGTALAR